ncbi:nuclear transport factor 2 family protein [Sphingomonas sp.]|jgi:ketosteroid isomerase-like protein|uniref:nuclear transport factor 2 family protein n=1 Tax=Sphingomonas sp. TaxID=28214 RepID=UPI002E14C2D2|nr:nuclear transport factor 2 family protein [Sphingomonas sp.]
MTIALPHPIAGYFRADRSGDATAIAAHFTDDATVRDEGHRHTGSEAIRAWKAQASGQYSYTVDPYAVADDGDRTVVTAHVSGNFPGSPVDLFHRFTLAGDRIAALEITP